jgi:hypothetical protein
MRLDAVNPQHADTVALLSGPLVLMSMSHQLPRQLHRATLLKVMRPAGSSRTWIAASEEGVVTLKAFIDIQNEEYATYLRVLST